MLVVKGKLVCLGQKLERKSTSFCPFLKMHRGKKVVLGVIWRKTGKKEGGRENTETGNAGGVQREKICLA